MNFKGVIIEESLINPSIFKKVKILKTKIEKVTLKHKTPWLQQWTLHTVEVPKDEADSVANAISNSLDYSHKSAWYADYKTREKDRKLLADKYGGGEDDLRKIIKSISTMLENDPEYLAYTEAWVEKDKVENSRPEVYVDSPDVIQQPVVQQPSFNNRINCTSSNIGNYTYTNCY